MKKISKSSMLILNLIFLNRRKVDGETYCPFSQIEMAKKSGLSIGTVNKCIRHLSDTGYITKTPNTFRKYELTEAGRKTVKKRKN